MFLRRLALAAALVAAATFIPGAQAAPPPPVLSTVRPVVTWTGDAGSAPSGCASTVAFCDHTALTIQAAAGAWVTVSVDGDTIYDNLRVTHDGAYVGGNGLAQTLSPDNKPVPTTTFQQVATGRITYDVAVGEGLPSAPSAGAHPYRATARLAGKGFDREGDCGATTGTEHLLDADDGRILPLSVQLVAEAKDMPTVRAAGRGLVDLYRRAGIAVRVTYQTVTLVEDGKPYAYQQVRVADGGARPPGVDVVVVMTDRFPGGFADCIGGIALPEKAFAVANVHYTVQGTVPVSSVQAALVAGHEIGHLLGAQHQQVSCAEALPALALQPAQDGSLGPCTLMGPAALQDSETFSTLERSTVRAFVRHYAKG